MSNFKFNPTSVKPLTDVTVAETPSVNPAKSKRHVSKNGIPYDTIEELASISREELILTYGPDAPEWVRMATL